MRKKWDLIYPLLHKEVIETIKGLEFAAMTPIQAATIPQLLAKKDVVAEAVTGSGKTLAFVIPLVEMLKRRENEAKWKRGEIGALIISPTRELALQIDEVLGHFLAHLPTLTKLLLVGGSPIENDIKQLQTTGGNIIVCTPGRFEDLLSRKIQLNLTSALKSLEILILDEADRLLDFGFQNSINTILGYLPRQRRTGLFSATQTKQVEDLIRAGLRNPVLITVNAKIQCSTPETLNNYYILVKNNNKLAALVDFIQNSTDIKKAMLFLPTCATVDYWADILPNLFKKQIEILAIHGKMKEKRKKVLDCFKEAPQALLLCTDVLARGIDIPEVDWVLQWDPPTNARAFVHRVGRTARQGTLGSSLILLLQNEEAYIPFIEKNQRVSLSQIADSSTDNKAETLRRIIHNLQKTNRDLMDKATRAFVSHIRAYSKHECSILLRVKELDMGAVASSYGLLKLPKMPELKHCKIDNFHGVGEEFDLNSIPYKNKKKEAIRLEKLTQFQETGVWPSSKPKIMKKQTEPWSLSKHKKNEKKEKKLKNKLAKEKKKLALEPPLKKRKKGISQEEMEELAKDVALMKKLKKKKISDEEFDKEFALM